MYNGLRVRGIDNTDVLVLGQDDPADMQTDLGFIIRKLGGTGTGISGQQVYEFNGERFTIEDISR